jgi:hypothetical protein
VSAERVLSVCWNFTQSLGGAEDAEVGWVFEGEEGFKFFEWWVEILNKEV